MRQSSSRAILLLALTAGAFLRIIGIQFGLPDLYHADEPIVINHALAYGTGDLNPHYFQLPPLLSYLVFGLFGFGFVLGKLAGQWGTSLEYAEAFLHDPTAWYLSARLVFGALVGTWTVWLTYRLAKQILGERAARLAAWCVACAFLHVRESHYVYCDIPLTALVLIIYQKILFSIENQGIHRLIAIGAWTGIALAMKYNAAFVTIPIAWAIVHVAKQRSDWTWGIKAVLIGIVFAALAFVLVNPFAVLDMKTFISDLLRERGTMAFQGPWYHFGYSLMGGVGSVMAIVGAMGLIGMLCQRQFPVRLVGCFPIVYYVVLSLASQLHERYVLLLIPFWAIGASWLVEQVWARQRWRRLAVAAVVGILVPNGVRSVALDWFLVKPDVRFEARQWIEQHLPDGATIAIDHQRFGPHLPRAAQQLRALGAGIVSGPQATAKQKKIEILARLAEQRSPAYVLYYLYPEKETPFTLSRPILPFDLDRLKAQGIEYVITHGRPSPIAAASFYRQLEQSGVVVKEFSPYRDGRVMARDRLPMTGAPFVDELFARRANGYPLRIYRIR